MATTHATLDPRPAAKTRAVPFARPTPHGDSAGMRLLCRLQTSLDPQQVLRIYFEELGGVLRLDGLHCQLNEPLAPIGIGRLARCRVVYRLQFEQELLAELTLSRRSTISDLEQLLLEQSMGLLLHPLRNALQYERAVSLARRDPLTGLGNRMALGECLSRELELSRRHPDDFSLIMLDVDNFKAINDRYGHPAGDRVLTALAGVLTECARQCDLLFRYAGDEFVVAMSRTGLTGARAMAERIQTALAVRPVGFDGLELPLRISMGVAAATAGEEPKELFARADRALLMAKRAGRDRIVLAE